ncbi:hypothetical protein [Limnoglobus roseus]|uniref:Uncharacterized protein n=1 Tax=Limnoglobus roseus TaxID=2598579 RepID=A0A5C1AI47_9BACT|nr:hypothetical protein [Limnoglobus roseus]QEL17676.1 hypothetical protein PX52LOC_04674 [Limnoglobus roseus]
MWHRWAGRVGRTLFAVAVLNFLAFFAHSQVVGGSAFNGKRVDGRYYVGNKGKYTEVSERQWQTMRAHEVSVFVTHTLGLFAGVALLTYADRGRRR